MDSSNILDAKSGESRILTSLRRSPLSGLIVTIWARTEVEDFMRSLGSGEMLDVQVLERYWQPAGTEKQSKKLYVYDLAQDLGPLASGDGLSPRLDLPGQPLMGEKEKYNTHTLNISFLRLVGISEPGGVSFAVSGVYSREAIDRLGELIKRATQHFYREFLKPYKLVVGVYTMPMSEGNS